MISLIVLAIIIASVTGRRRDRRRSDFFKFSLAGVIGIGILAAIVAPYLFPLALIFLIIFAINKYNESKRNSDFGEGEWSEKAKSAGYNKKKTTFIDEFLDGLFGTYEYKSGEKPNRNPYSAGNSAKTDQYRVDKELEILRKKGRGAYRGQRTYPQNPNMQGQAYGQQGGPVNGQYQGNQYQGNQYQGNQYQGNQYQGNQYQGNQYQGNQYQGNQYQGNQYANRGQQGAYGQYRGTAQTRRPSDSDFNKGDMRLPTAPKKRRKIVETFNEKYNLYLTEEQIESIVNASYFSAAWHKEIVDMNKKYATVHQWMSGPLAWLRTYIYAFPIQDITSDLYQQERIVVYAFDQVFAYLDALGPMSMANRIRVANQKFLTNFDDITFMDAYNFLRSKGINYELKNDDISKSYDPIDDLMKKYAADPVDDLVAKYAVDGQGQPAQR